MKEKTIKLISQNFSDCALDVIGNAIALKIGWFYSLNLVFYNNCVLIENTSSVGMIHHLLSPNNERRLATVQERLEQFFNSEHFNIKKAYKTLQA